MTKRPARASVAAGAVVLAALPCASAPSQEDVSAAQRKPSTTASAASPGPSPSVVFEQGPTETQATKELARARERLAKVEQRLRTVNDEPAADGEVRAAAEAKARLALEELFAVAPVSLKQEPRGTIITIPSRVLFASDEPRLSHAGEARLEPIAEALSRDGRHRIVVEDHSNGRDAEGSVADLSQSRAEAVREFLVSRGVRSELLTATGIGAHPSSVRGVAPQGKGKAHERRLEIVIEPSRER
jgi:OmpA-OmpF porin, OOP family